MHASPTGSSIRSGPTKFMIEIAHVGIARSVRVRGNEGLEGVDSLLSRLMSSYLVPRCYEHAVTLKPRIENFFDDLWREATCQHCLVATNYY